MNKILLGLSILAGLTISAQAVCYAEGCTGKIKKIYITKGNKIYVGTDGDESKANCTSPANVYFTIPDAASPAGKTLYSALLTAQTTKSTIELRTVDGSDGCEIAYAVLQ